MSFERLTEAKALFEVVENNKHSRKRNWIGKLSQAKFKHFYAQWCRAGLTTRVAHVERCCIWANPIKNAGIRWKHQLKTIEIAETFVEIL